MKALIVDDEQKARENLKNLLSEYCPDVKIINSVGTIKEALQVIKDTELDLVFLDIEMDGETGFDLLEHLEKVDFNVIFITAHDEYALRAFRYSALDYLLKPVDIDDLEAAIERVDKKSNNIISKQQLDFLFQQLKTDRLPPKLIIPTTESIIFVDYDEIVRCEADEGYTYVRLVNKETICSSKNIKYFDDLLGGRGFFRIHRSHLINLREVKEYLKTDGGYVIMKDKSTLPVARRKRSEFLDEYGGE
jgi:two-component system LytT family response regulator